MDIIYTTNTDGQGAVFADRTAAEEVAQIWAALRDSETWGEFKSRHAAGRVRHRAGEPRTRQR